MHQRRIKISIGVLAGLVLGFSGCSEPDDRNSAVRTGSEQDEDDDSATDDGPGATSTPATGSSPDDPAADDDDPSDGSLDLIPPNRPGDPGGPGMVPSEPEPRPESQMCGGPVCGGDVVGSWLVTEFCLDVSVLNTAFAGLLAPQCDGLFQSATTTPLDVVVTYSADGTTTMSGRFEMSVQSRYTEACVNALTESQGTLEEFCAFLPEPAENGSERSTSCAVVGRGCNCETTSLLQPASDASSYTISGTNIVTTGGSTEPYCVESDMLILHGSDGSGSLRARRLP